MAAPTPDQGGGAAADDTVVAAIGGGHGLARTLTALRMLGVRPSAIVSVADDGGSSGRLRRELAVHPPGDLRLALSTLSGDSLTRELLEYRFPDGDLAGHALGNLVLLGAAALRGGDLSSGLDDLAQLFGARGRIIPASLDHLELEAVLGTGETISGQERVAGTCGVRHVRLRPPDARATPAAVAAIGEADLVVVGPGSLFTSLVPPLLVPGIREALAASTATKVLVANLREQAGETEGMDLQAHLDAFFDHLGPALRMDVLVANDGPVPAHGPAALAPVASHPRIGRVLTAALADAGGGHDPAALAGVLARLA